MEYVISHSFSQFQHERELPQLESRLQALEVGGPNPAVATGGNRGCAGPEAALQSVPPARDSAIGSIEWLLLLLLQAEAAAISNVPSETVQQYNSLTQVGAGMSVPPSQWAIGSSSCIAHA